MPALRVATRQDLARVHAGSEQAADFLSWSERAAERARQAYGPAHPATLRAELVRADALQALRRHEDALVLRRRVLELQEQLLGPHHPDMLTSLRGLLTELLMLRRAGRVDVLPAAERERLAELAPLWEPLPGTRHAADTAPALSAVVLSQRNLPPGSELTVLSACDSALLGPVRAGRRRLTAGQRGRPR